MFYQSLQIILILRIKEKAARLTAIIPLSALGYFNLDNSLITAIIGTTLTYLVILMTL